MTGQYYYSEHHALLSTFPMAVDEAFSDSCGTT